jgi:hypothetical protein
MGIQQDWSHLSLGLVDDDITTEARNIALAEQATLLFDSRIAVGDGDDASCAFLGFARFVFRWGCFLLARRPRHGAKDGGQRRAS